MARHHKDTFDRLHEAESRIEKLEEALRWIFSHSNANKHMHEKAAQNALDQIEEWAFAALKSTPESEGQGVKP